MMSSREGIPTILAKVPSSENQNSSSSSSSSPNISPGASPHVSPSILRAKSIMGIPSQIHHEESSSSSSPRSRLSSPRTGLQRIAASNSRDMREIRDPLYDYTLPNMNHIAFMDATGHFTFFFRVYRLVHEKRSDRIVKIKCPFNMPFTNLEENALYYSFMLRSNSSMIICMSSKINSCCIEVSLFSKQYSREYIEENVLPKIIRYYDERNNEKFMYLSSMLNNKKLEISRQENNINTGSSGKTPPKATFL